MDFGKYKRALRAATRPTHLRKVVYNPSIDDTDVDFPDIENPRMFAGGGAVKIIKRILSADGLRRLAKKEGIPSEDVEKFLSGEYGILKRDQARGVVKRDKDGNIVVQDKYSEKYDPIRKQMLKDDPGMFDDIFDRMFSEYQYDMYKKSGRKPNSEGGVVEREGFYKGGFSKFKYKTLEEFQQAMQEQVNAINADDFFDSNNLARKRIAEHFGYKKFELIPASVKKIVDNNLIGTEIKVKNHFQNVVDDIYNIPYDDIVDAGGFTKYISKPFNFTNRKRVSNLLKDDPDFKAISNLSQRLSGNNTLKNYGGKNLLVGDVIDQLDIKRTGIFNKGLGFGYKIADIANRSIKSGNKNIKFIKGYEPGKVDEANVLFEMDGKIYGVDPNFDKINGKKIINVNQVGESLPEFENIKLAYEKADARANKPVVFNGKETTYGDLLKETYAKGYGKDSYYKQNPYEVDHLNIKDNPFDNVRVLPRHINQAAGSIKRTTSIIKGNEAKAKALNKLGYNIPEEAIDNAVLKFADRVVNKKQKLNTAYDVAKLNLIRPDTDPYYKIPEEKLSFEDVQIGDKKRQGRFTKEQSYVETPTGKRPVSPKERIPINFKSIENLNVKDKIANKLRNDAGLQQAALTKYPVCKGRKEGGDLATCIAENLIKDAEKIETGNATQRMVAGNRFKDIVRKGGGKTKDGLRVIQKGLSAGVGGGLGLALEGILEALLVGWDMSANAAPLDEALQANTILASGAVEFLPEGKLKESLGGGLISGPSAERLKIEKAIEGNNAAQRYDQAKQALDEYDTLKKRVETLSRTQLGEDYGAYQEALQKFKEYEEELMFLGDMDEYRKILTPGSYESNEYKRVMTEQASERTGQAYRDRELGMNEGLVDPAAVEQARAEEFKDQTEMIYGNDMTEEQFMNQYRNNFYKFFGEKFGNPELQPGQSKFADNVIDMHLRDQYKNNLKLFEGIRRQEYSGGGLTRRAFLKLVGGLGALGVGLKSGLVKLKSTVAKQTLENAPKGTPDWFAPLVDKIKTQGKDMSDTLATIERESVTVLKVPVLDNLDQPIKVQQSKSGVKIEENVSDTYTLYENPDTGEISVRVDSDAGVNNMPVDFNMTPTRITGTTDEGKPIVEPGEFVVVEERAVGRQVGPDDYDIDLDEYVTNDLDDAASDWHSVEEFATGKTDKTAQTKKRVIKDAIENDPGEDVISRQGELLDYDQGDDYD